MASDGVEEEDIPELESLSSSECVEEDAEDDDEHETASGWPSDGRLVDGLQYPPPPANSTVAVQWLCRGWAAIEKQMHIISLYTLSPFLYGCSYQSEKWLQWLCQAKLLNSDKHFTTGLLDQQACYVVDILEHAYLCMMDWMRKGWPPNGAHPVGVTYMLDLLEEVRDCRELWEAIDRVKKNHWFSEVVQSSGEQFSYMYGDGTVVTRHPNLLITAYLYILTNTAECVHWFVENREQDITTPFGRFAQYHDQKVDGLDALQNEGILFFSCQKYEEAVRKYDCCVKKYPFCSNVFLQRSLCFLELKKPMEAVSDGLRAYHLDPSSQPVREVYVRALREAGERDKAMMVKAKFEIPSFTKERLQISSYRAPKVPLSDFSKSNEDVAMEVDVDQSESERFGASSLNNCNTSRHLDAIMRVLNTFAIPVQPLNDKSDPYQEQAVGNYIEHTEATAELDMPIQRDKSHSIEAARSGDAGHSMEATRVGKSDSSTYVHGGKTCSVEDKAISVAAEEVPLPCGSHGLECDVAWDKTVTSLDSKQQSVVIKPAAIVSVDACVQSECSTADKGMVTEPIPPVETFKERYEGLVAEKKSLCAKLEESEDKRVQLHKEHKRELERVQKKVRQEVQDESNAKVMSLEAQLLDERIREQQGKKEQAELIKALKLEAKTHKEKADKCRKDLNKKEHELETRLGQFQADMDKGYTDKKKMEERMKEVMDSRQKALGRAMSAEVELVTLKRDITLKGLENDLLRIETISQNMVSTGEYHQQLTSFKEKFKSALSTYQATIDEVIKQLKNGRELSTLIVPEPCMPAAPIPQSSQSASLQHSAMRSMLMPLMPQHQNMMPQTVPRPLPQGIPPVAPQLSVSQGVLQGPSQQVPPQGILPTSSQGPPQSVFQGVAQGSSKSMPQGSPQSMAQGIPLGSQSIPQSLHQGVPQSLIQQGLRATQAPGILRGLSQGMPQQGLLQGMPQQGLLQGMPQQGLLQGMPQQGLPQGMPQQGLPQQGLPQQGLPQQGLPQQGLPQQGLSQGMPQQGLPQGLPQQGLPQSVPQQGLLQGASQLGLLPGISQNMSHDLLQGIPNGLPFGTNTVYSSLSSMMPALANMPSIHESPLAMPVGYTLPSAPIVSTQPMVTTAPMFQESLDTAFIEQELTSTPRKKGLDRILQNLAPYYPQLSREECKAILSDIRKKQRGNALSGYSLDYLSVQVKAVLDAANPENTQARLSMATQQPIQQPGRPLLSGPSAPVNEYDDEGCIICYDEMGPLDTTKLGCGHCFHTGCIRSWLKEQRTCPTCRNHALLTDDYPFLDQPVQKAH